MRGFAMQTAITAADNQSIRSRDVASPGPGFTQERSRPMKLIIIASLTFVFAIGDMGHTQSAAAAESKPASATLAPMPKPTPQVGDTRT